MKLEIYEESAPKGETVRLRLVPGAEEGSVLLCAVDTYGDRVPAGHLLTFTADGVIERHADVTRVLGFQLDESRHIKIKDP